MTSRIGVELRSAKLEGNTLKGYAAVYDSATDRAGADYEAIGQGAFDGVLERGADVRMLVNHDPSKLLGRTASGTLRLRSDSHGLAFECDLPDTADGRDLKTLVERGDITGMSFGFIPGESVRTRAQDGRQLRMHTAVKQLLDVSCVTYPAYDGTCVALRSVQLSSVAVSPEQMLRSQLIRARARVQFQKGHGNG